MSDSKFIDLLKFLKDKKILITTHNFVDIDGYTSAYVLREFLTQFLENKDVHLLFPEFTKQTLFFIEKLSQKFPDTPFLDNNIVSLSEIDIILIVDTNDLGLVRKDIIDSGIPMIFLDHHYSEGLNYENNLKSYNIILDNYSSAAEIIHTLIKSHNFRLKDPFNYLLMAGILTDSGFFRFGSNDTIKHFNELMDDGLDFQEFRLLLNYEEDTSEKIAKIKGLQRIRLIQKGDWLIGVSNIGSFESSVATILTRVGFDIGVVYTKKKSENRISARATKKICLETGLHLGKFMEELSNKHGGNGGGHDGAAGFNYNESVETIVDELLIKIKQVLKNH